MTKKDNSKYINREISYLEFAQKIIEVANDSQTPLLEKLRFLIILGTCLDEFFMVRVSGVKKMLKKGEEHCDSPDKMPNQQLLLEIRQRILTLLTSAQKLLTTKILPSLELENIGIKKYKQLSPKQRKYLQEYFFTNIFPMLTPLAFDSTHPFPYLSSLSEYLLVTFKQKKEEGSPRIGFIEIPSSIESLVAISPEENWYVHLSELISTNLQEVFIGREVDNSYYVRVTRDWDYELVDDEVLDLLTTIQLELDQEHRETVRLEVDLTLPEEILSAIKNYLCLEDPDIYSLTSPFSIANLSPLLNVFSEEHKYPPFNPRLPKRLVNNRDIFALISSGDLLVHHPFESFYTVVEFLHEAAHDEKTLAIKQTLYRTSGDSPIIDILITAAKNGKKVTAIVELKARFDEKNNILWAKRLEKAGVNVVYGFIHVKTHLKSTIVARKEEQKIVQYVHLSTGNYNPKTAKTYTDISLFTANEDYCRDIALLFNILTGYHLLWNEQKGLSKSSSPRFKKMAVAPFDLRKKILANIEHTIRCHRKDKKSMIIAKMNALVDEAIIDKLYAASQAGVEIKLIVRGICCLKPQIPGLSDNIEVTSTVGRFLEHSRIFYFYAGGEKNVFLSSADWMPRNMDRRIEVMYPVLEERLQEQITEFILPIYVNDSKAWCLQSDGTYSRRKNRKKMKNAHDLLIEYARESGIKSIPYELAIRSPAKVKEKNNHDKISKAERKR